MRMPGDWDLVILWGTAFVGLGAAILSWQRDLKVMREHRRRSSRFPLLALRDDLLELVVSGEVSEQSEAWRAAYARINDLLRLS